MEQQPLVDGDVMPKSSLGPASVMITAWTTLMGGMNWFTQTEGLKMHTGPDMKSAVCSLMFYFMVCTLSW